LKDLTIDIFYKTYCKDYPFLIHSLKSLKKHARGFRKIVLITDFGQKDELEKIVERLNLPVIEIFELCQDLDTHPPTRLPKFLAKVKKQLNRSLRIITPDRIGYEVQKAVKCNWPEWSDADAVVQIDSDTILTHAFDVISLFENGKPVWFKRKWSQCGAQAAKMWKKGTLYFYNKEALDYHYMIRPIFLVTRELAIELEKYVKDTFDCSFYSLFSNPRLPRMSEYDLLGFYADNKDLRLEYKIYDLDESTGPLPKAKQFWSWGGITDEVRDEIEKL